MRNRADKKLSTSGDYVALLYECACDGHWTRFVDHQSTDNVYGIGKWDNEDLMIRLKSYLNCGVRHIQPCHVMLFIAVSFHGDSTWYNLLNTNNV